MKTLKQTWKTTNDLPYYPLEYINNVLHLSFDFLSDEDVKSVYAYDIDYIFNHSGDKIISPLLEAFLDEDGHLTETGKDLVCKHIYQTYANKWNRLWDTINESYNALENYDRREDTTVTTDGTNSATSTNTVADETVENTVSAFDSASYMPDNKSKSHKDGNDINTSSATGHNTVTTSGRIHGNIGVTTSTQMMASEWLERQKVKYREMIYSDMDSILTCPIWWCD